MNAWVTHILHITKAPLDYWCFCVEYVCLLRSVLAKESLQWRTPHELHWGHTPDISIFKYMFWQPLWYHAPTAKFPTTRMRRARFIGMAATISDQFCYLILTEPKDEKDKPQILARLVIKPRYTNEKPPVVFSRCGDNKLVFYKSDGKTPLEDPLDADLTNFFDTVATNKFAEELDLITAKRSLDDSFEVGINEVFGPPTKRQRIITCTNDDLSSPTTAVTQQQVHAVVTTPVEYESPIQHPVTYSIIADTPVPDTKDAEDLAVIITDDAGDGHHHDPIADPNLHAGISVITQDDDVDADISLSVADQLYRTAVAHVDDEDFCKISSHKWLTGVLLVGLQKATDEIHFVPFSLVKVDYPSELAQYIITNKIGASDNPKHTSRYMNWARNYQRHMKSALRRLIRINDDSCHLDDDTDTVQDFMPRRSYKQEKGNEIPISKVRTARVNTPPHAPGKKKKPGRTRRPFETKYGIKIPINVKDAYDFYKINGNTLWTDAIDVEIKSLLKLNCFKFEAPNFKPGKEYQYTSLRMIFEVKQDGRHKARLVAGGHLVKLHGMSSKSTVVKGISVRLLDIIAHRSKLETICGDVGNDFVTAPCLEKVFPRAGPEFGDKEDSIVIIIKALYGLKSSSRAFRTYFADFIRTAVFSQQDTIVTFGCVN